jgi:hypothetical protein
MAEDEGKGLLGTQVRKPRAGEDPCDRDDEVVTIGRNRRETRLWAGLHVLVQHDLAVLSRMQTSMVRAYRSRPQYAWCCGVSKRLRYPPASRVVFPGASSPTVVC